MKVNEGPNMLLKNIPQRIKLMQVKFLQHCILGRTAVVLEVWRRD